MMRVVVGLALLVSVGCASTVDTLTSRRFRQDPYTTLFKSEDPMMVLRTPHDGDQRAKAMRELGDSPQKL
ncbi:MAG: hypothetical protein ACRCZF_10260, partial [Gemmataceae bacterium]